MTDSLPAAVASVSPFDDPTPSPAIPQSELSNSDTNPFRVRAVSTSGGNGDSTPILASFPTSPGPKSKNPFLDLAVEGPEATAAEEKTMAPVALVKENATTKDRKEASPPSQPVSSSTNKSHRPHPRPHRRPDDPTAPRRPSSSHRRRDPNRPPSRDKERDRHRERRERPPPGDPSHRSTLPRSNSESSNAVERAHRTREIKDGHVHKPRSSRPHKDDKKDVKTSGSSKRRLHPVDKIDLLDVTGLYGPGFFHHDGPFDPCRPHRNKHSHKAPVAAFPADSLTNTLAGGLGEVPGLDRDKYFGLAPREAFEDYGHVGNNNAPTKKNSTITRLRRTSNQEASAAPLPVRSLDDIDKIRPSVGVRSASFDPRLKTELVHGVESAGLGTSTFLEGAPAPKSAIEKATAEEDDGVLVRKMSLVQKIKARRATSGDRSPPPHLTMPGPILPSPTNENIAPPATLEAAYNPALKEAQFVERVESVPAATRERADSGGSDKGGNAGGLLGRVKSLKISAGRKVPNK